MFDHLLGSAFAELALLLLIAAALGAVGVVLRQPLIVTFIAVGIVVGPAGLNIIKSGDQVQVLAELGVSLLLFLVGLKLDIQLMRQMGRVALSTGLGQVAFTSVVGWLIGLALGFDTLTAFYIAVALTFSSTIIIVKLLSDKREIDALHGRIAIGFLIVQDIVVVLAMIALSAMALGASDEPLQAALVRVLLQGVGLLVAVGLAARFVLPPLTNLLARSQELLMLFAIAWAAGLSFGAEHIGLSKEVGAFLGGVSLASSPFREAIGARLVGLRDFLLLFFFIHLGAGLQLEHLGTQLGKAAVFSLFVLIGNPLIVLVIMGAMGYRKRTSFLAGLTVAQISEFSLILAAMGMQIGHIDHSTMGLITLVGLFTIGLSTYMIIYSHPLYERLAPLLSVFERRVTHRESDGSEQPGAKPADVYIFGLGRFGSNLAEALKSHGLTSCGVDFDPEAVKTWRQQHGAAHYGDAEDPELTSHLPLRGVRWVISTVPDKHLNLTLLRNLQHHGYGGQVALTAHRSHEKQAYEKAGADLVLLPFVGAAEHAANCLVATA